MSTPGAAWQRRDIAETFVKDRRHLIPLIEGQDELVRRLITRGERQVTRFLDLGAGGGAFAELVLETHPGSTGVLVDFSEPMAAAANHLLTAHAGRWDYVLADLADPSWSTVLPEGLYDAVVSALCIHHLPDERKCDLYRQAYDLLEAGGMFLNWEHVAAQGIGAGMLEEWMLDRLVTAEQARPNPRPDDEVVREYCEASGEDILADAEVQCRWLREIGFEDVDVFFKIPEMAIFGGVKGGG
jgi:tRNA (cmo5U34)-methyltransferase